MEGHEDIQGQQVATMDMLDSNAPKFNAKILSWKKKDYTQIFEKIYLLNQIKKM